MNEGTEDEGKEKRDSGSRLRRRWRSMFSSSLCTKNLRNNKARGRGRWRENGRKDEESGKEPPCCREAQQL